MLLAQFLVLFLRRVNRTKVRESDLVGSAVMKKRVRTSQSIKQLKKVIDGDCVDALDGAFDRFAFDRFDSIDEYVDENS